MLDSALVCDCERRNASIPASQNQIRSGPWKQRVIRHLRGMPMPTDSGGNMRREARQRPKGPWVRQLRECWPPDERKDVSSLTCRCKGIGSLFECKPYFQTSQLHAESTTPVCHGIPPLRIHQKRRSRGRHSCSLRVMRLVHDHQCPDHSHLFLSALFFADRNERFGGGAGRATGWESHCRWRL